MAKSSGSNTLVVVDDEPDVHEDIEVCLPVGPIDNLLKFGSKEAFDEAFGQPGQGVTAPALFFVDLRMESNRSGIEILSSIRTSGELKHVPVVILSTSDENEDVFAAYESGANFYLPKGNDPDTLSDAVKGLLHFWTTTGRLPRRTAA